MAKRIQKILTPDKATNELIAATVRAIRASGTFSKARDYNPRKYRLIPAFNIEDMTRAIKNLELALKGELARREAFKASCEELNKLREIELNAD